MQISGSPIPFHVARAYGVSPSKPVTRPAAPPATTQPGPADAASAARTASRPEALDRFVAGTVQRPMDFDDSTARPKAAGVLPLYNRAADKVEATLGVSLGRTLDLKG